MLLVNEIFHSIQGESTYTGLSCVFIRLTGCNLRCSYCDTTYAYDEGNLMSISHIMEKVATYQTSLVEITGGEPLCQQETPQLAKKLLIKEKTVLVETNGSIPINILPEKTIRIMDIKCPSSQQMDKMDWKNIDYLKPIDEVKFVIADKNDYRWARQIIEKYDLTKRTQILFSAIFESKLHNQLAEWIIADQLNVRLQLQMHKMLWPGQRGK